MFAPLPQVCVLRLQGCKPSVLCYFLSLATPPRIPPTPLRWSGTPSPPPGALHCTALHAGVCLDRRARCLGSQLKQEAPFLKRVGGGESRMWFPPRPAVELHDASRAAVGGQNISCVKRSAPTEQEKQRRRVLSLSSARERDPAEGLSAFISLCLPCHLARTSPPSRLSI